MSAHKGPEVYIWGLLGEVLLFATLLGFYDGTKATVGDTEASVGV